VLPHWPRELDGLRVVHLSDIHVGGGMTRERLLRVAELTNRAKADLVAHTGDFLTHRSGEFDLPLYEALARIHAPFGQWACLGNHDYEDPDRLVRRLHDAGVTTLRNTRARIEVGGHPLELAGSEFVFPRPSRPSAYGRLIEAWGPRVGSRLFLNHDPLTFRGLPDGAADLVLSGHTHGGHVGVQLGPRHALTVVGLVGLPDQGVFARGDMRLFVTRCVGFYGYPRPPRHPPRNRRTDATHPPPRTDQPKPHLSRAQASASPPRHARWPLHPTKRVAHSATDCESKAARSCARDLESAGARGASRTAYEPRETVVPETGSKFSARRIEGPPRPRRPRTAASTAARTTRPRTRSARAVPRPLPS
jgi:predicted MPP superfamily phosphohydrolase